MPKTSDDAPFSYDGLDRVLHEKARLGIMTSLMMRSGRRSTAVSSPSRPLAAVEVLKSAARSATRNCTMSGLSSTMSTLAARPRACSVRVEVARCSVARSISCKR